MISVSSSIGRPLAGFGLTPQTPCELPAVPNIVPVGPQTEQLRLRHIGARAAGRLAALEALNERQHLVPALRGA